MENVRSRKSNECSPGGCHKSYLLVSFLFVIKAQTIYSSSKRTHFTVVFAFRIMKKSYCFFANSNEYFPLFYFDQNNSTDMFFEIKQMFVEFGLSLVPERFKKMFFIVYFWTSIYSVCRTRNIQNQNVALFTIFENITFYSLADNDNLFRLESLWTVKFLHR